MNEHTVKEIGVPVRSVNRAGLYPGVNSVGQPRIIATMSQQAANFFILVIDPDTGAFSQLTVDEPESNYTTAVFSSSTGRFYIGAAHSGMLYCYDPSTEGLLTLGEIHPQRAIFPCRIDEDSSGGIWISSYGTADLTKYEPKTGEFTHFGRMDEIDMYAYCFVNTDDTVACLIRQTRPHVVVLDPVSGEKRIVGPTVDKGEGELTLFRGTDRALYIKSSEGNFRIEGMNAIAVDGVPDEFEPTAMLPDGRSFRYLDADEHIHRNLEISSPDGSSVAYELDYQAAGTDIFCLHGGPDGCVYGSSVLPEHFFRYDPTTGEMIDFGVCSESVGEAYSMANYGGKIYISSYPAARVSEYDPSRPYQYGDSPDSNPRELGRIDDISYRPRSTIAGPGGKVWFASIPDYGLWGGPLAWYDPETEEKRSFKRIVGDASCYTLAWLQQHDLLAVGSTIQAGSGTQPRVDRAVLFLFDYATEEKGWEGHPDRLVTSFNSLVSGGDGKLYGSYKDSDGAGLFAFDIDSREFTDWFTPPAGDTLDNGLQLRPDDGAIYGVTRQSVFRFYPPNTRVETVVEFAEPLSGHAAPGPIIRDELYVSSGHRLLSVVVK